MPFVFLALGLMLIITGARNTQDDLFTLVKSDFAGTTGGISGSFLPWILAIMAIGALGFIKPIRPVSDAFLLLVIIVLFLSNKGVFNQLKAQL